MTKFSIVRLIEKNRLITYTDLALVLGFSLHVVKLCNYWQVSYIRDFKQMFQVLDVATLSEDSNLLLQ